MTPRHALNLTDPRTVDESKFVQIWVFEPGEPGQEPIGRDELVEWMTARLDRSRVFTEIVEFRSPLAYPVWRTAEHVDVADHIRCLDLDGAGWDGLTAELARIVAAPMDLSRPLWELHAITGVRDVPGIPDDAYYIVIKFQHAIGDGIEAGAISRRLFDAPDADVEKPEPEYTPPGLLRQVASVPGQVVSMLRAARRTKEAVAELDALTARGEIPPAPTAVPNRFNSPASGGAVVVDVARRSLDAAQAARRTVPGVTVNDFALAVVSGAMREYLRHHGELGADPVVVASPMSLVPLAERRGNPEQASNQFGMILVDLHVQEPDPRVRLQKIAESTAQGKQRSRSAPAMIATTALDDYPWWMARKVVAATHHAVEAGTGISANAMITNVPRGSSELTLFGRRSLEAFNLSSVHSGFAMSITSLGSELSISFTANAAAMPDPQRFRRALEDSFDTLVSALGTTDPDRPAVPVS
ncbi:WS/DGAT domain-containing protein [Rhodococcus sp. HM1]|uniref:wax ester/triacylglycerol synthase domain-containing protein n=1 Tax=unclassified Rhodococcus (in: high G+C Gram-positive bacteria) TaxID=192944 RepID=UPI0018CF043D|nr:MULTISPECIES: wax ester/triacylglycerol synthase domain-containing protein [unclassified Rhodococcus (in: high G+C Gram-positive bacteria)]MBH0123278.1 DUF1298 domain-containing protein [Rhodococcus sp. CX]MCK8673815.1 WS/DGAT domain-containing protein [Rhodococcus sp. HM1]